MEDNYLISLSKNEHGLHFTLGNHSVTVRIKDASIETIARAIERVTTNYTGSQQRLHDMIELTSSILRDKNERN